jgi:adenosylhomocysteine nucleosidase
MAGGLDPALETGTVVIPGSVAFAGEEPIESDNTWCDRLVSRLASIVPVSTGSMMTVQGVATEPEQKRSLFTQHGCVAVDMETAAIARVAKELGLPWIAVRVVVDAAHDRLPDLDAIGPDGQISTASILFRAALHPKVWGDLLTLRGCHRTAGHAMRRVWEAAASDLARTSPTDS